MLFLEYMLVFSLMFQLLYNFLLFLRVAHKKPNFQSIYLFLAQKKLVVNTIGNIHIIDVALASTVSNFNRYVNAGTNISPPPVENNPDINPASIPIIIFFIVSFLFILLLWTFILKKFLIFEWFNLIFGVFLISFLKKN